MNFHQRVSKQTQAHNLICSFVLPQKKSPHDVFVIFLCLCMKRNQHMVIIWVRSEHPLRNECVDIQKIIKHMFTYLHVKSFPRKKKVSRCGSSKTKENRKKCLCASTAAVDFELVHNAPFSVCFLQSLVGNMMEICAC